jgi:hypothetical protein
MKNEPEIKTPEVNASLFESTFCDHAIRTINNIVLKKLNVKRKI